jgi:hypothetical protein
MQPVSNDWFRTKTPDKVNDTDYIGCGLNQLFEGWEQGALERNRVPMAAKDSF